MALFNVKSLQKKRQLRLKKNNHLASKSYGMNAAWMLG